MQYHNIHRKSSPVASTTSFKKPNPLIYILTQILPPILAMQIYIEEKELVPRVLYKNL